MYQNFGQNFVNIFYGQNIEDMGIFVDFNKNKVIFYLKHKI